MKRLAKIFVIFSAVWVVGNVALSQTNSTSTGVDPLRNASGKLRGLGAVPKSGLPRARRMIMRLRVAPVGSRAGYRRDLFGEGWTEGLDILWGRNGCRTRDDILRRDLLRESPVMGCTVQQGDLVDPYTGREIAFERRRARTIHIDHIIPLVYAYQMRLKVEDRDEFANDPRNLLAVDGRENQRKGDDGPSEWLPPNVKIRCGYVVIWARVAREYNVAVTEQDRATMLEQCQ